jgi:hypothetical protein
VPDGGKLSSSGISEPAAQPVPTIPSTSNVPHGPRSNLATVMPVIPKTVSAVTGANSTTNWEDSLDEILSGEGDDAAKARSMLELFPKAPAEGQAEIAQHIANLTADEDYAGVAHYATNSTLPEEVLEVFVDDLMNRPNSVKLPTLLQIARDDKHPKAADAKEVLELFLEEDYGTDWAKWQTKMQEWLQENPD